MNVFVAVLSAVPPNRVTSLQGRAPTTTVVFAEDELGNEMPVLVKYAPEGASSKPLDAVTTPDTHCHRETLPWRKRRGDRRSVSFAAVLRGAGSWNHLHLNSKIPFIYPPLLYVYKVEKTSLISGRLFWEGLLQLEKKQTGYSVTNQ